MPVRCLILITFLLTSCIAIGQVDHRKAFVIVLKHNHAGREYSFSQSKNIIVSKTVLRNYDSLVLVYFGKIKTKDGRTLKFLTSRWYWNTSPRATSRNILFNGKNQYLGDYYLTMTDDIPDFIQGNYLVFINGEDSDCTPGLSTKVNFRRGIPKQFFLKCTSHLGDVYSFAENL